MCDGTAFWLDTSQQPKELRRHTVKDLDEPQKELKKMLQTQKSVVAYRVMQEMNMFPLSSKVHETVIREDWTKQATLFQYIILQKARDLHMLCEMQLTEIEYNINEKLHKEFKDKEWWKPSFFVTIKFPADNCFDCDTVKEKSSSDIGVSIGVKYNLTIETWEAVSQYFIYEIMQNMWVELTKHTIGDGAQPLPCTPVPLDPRPEEYDTYMNYIDATDKYRPDSCREYWESRRTSTGSDTGKHASKCLRDLNKTDKAPYDAFLSCMSYKHNTKLFKRRNKPEKDADDLRRIHQRTASSSPPPMVQQISVEKITSVHIADIQQTYLLENRALFADLPTLRLGALAHAVARTGKKADEYRVVYDRIRAVLGRESGNVEICEEFINLDDLQNSLQQFDFWCPPEPIRSKPFDSNKYKWASVKHTYDYLLPGIDKKEEYTAERKRVLQNFSSTHFKQTQVLYSTPNVDEGKTDTWYKKTKFENRECKIELPPHACFNSILVTSKGEGDILHNMYAIFLPRHDVTEELLQYTTAHSKQGKSSVQPGVCYALYEKDSNESVKASDNKIYIARLHKEEEITKYKLTPKAKEITIFAVRVWHELDWSWANWLNIKSTEKVAKQKHAKFFRDYPNYRTQFMSYCLELALRALPIMNLCDNYNAVFANTRSKSGQNPNLVGTRDQPRVHLNKLLNDETSSKELEFNISELRHGLTSDDIPTYKSMRCVNAFFGVPTPFLALSQNVLRNMFQQNMIEHNVVESHCKRMYYMWDAKVIAEDTRGQYAGVQDYAQLSQYNVPVCASILIEPAEEGTYGYVRRTLKERGTTAYVLVSMAVLDVSTKPAMWSETGADAEILKPERGQLFVCPYWRANWTWNDETTVSLPALLNARIQSL